MDKQLYNFYANDKLGFFTDHVLVPNRKSSAMTKIELFGWKQQILYANYILIRKQRAMGISELFAADIAYNLNFQDNFDMLCMTPNISMSIEMKNKVIRHFSNIPDNIRIGLKAVQNKFTYETTNDNMVLFSGESSTVGRSKSFHTLYMEEVDVMTDFENAYQNLGNCVSPGKSRILIATTPLSSQSYFHTMWNSLNSMFDKLEVTHGKTLCHGKRQKDKTLNDITKTAYSKIIRECAIS